MALAAINAFSQFGNIAGSYVWSLEDNGFRESYGIVTAMFGVTIVGCYVFRLSLNRLNNKLEEDELAEWDVGEDVIKQTVAVEGTTVEEALKMRKGFRYLV